ncbi:MAG: hypothetical protein NW206_13060 [Hyphomonadaceae bacterium]|nr:hypothetical protein [Hyphomonadaceae bacterium]
MLQHNAAEAGRRAHLAHAAVVGLHTLCCGLPAFALLLTAVSGATSGVTLFAEYAGTAHAILHAHELWILGLSAVLVLVGGVLELVNRRDGRHRGWPWLYLVSVGCFALNLAIILAHRAG